MFLSYTDYVQVREHLQLNESILNKSYMKAINLITSYLSKKLETKVVHSNAGQEIKNDNGTLSCCYLGFGDNAELIRLEWLKDSSKGTVNSFSYFNGKQSFPSRTIITGDSSLAVVLPAILKVIKSPTVSIKDLNLIEGEEGNLNEQYLLKEGDEPQKLTSQESKRYAELLQKGKKGKTAVENAEFIKLAAKKFGDSKFMKSKDEGGLGDTINTLPNDAKSLVTQFKEGKISKSEMIESVAVLDGEQRLASLVEDKTDAKSFNAINPDDNKKSKYDLTLKELFTEIDTNTLFVAKGIKNGFLLTGMGGLGKTYNVEKVLKQEGMVEDEDWFKVAGAASTAKVYQALFKNNGKLTVFDDCDSVLKDEDCVNIFKAALDTGSKRVISYDKNGYFDPRKFDNDPEDEGYIEMLDNGKFPSKFEFTGQVIFISNWDMRKIPQPMQTRCFKLDLQLTASEVKEHIQNLLPVIGGKEYDLKLKQQMLNCLGELMDEKEIKYMTIRDFVVGLPKFEVWVNLEYNNERLKAHLLRGVVAPQD